MGVFRNFPYSNFHELNLDDIIKNIKSLNIEFESLENKFDNLITEIHNYIREYLNNIHIPTNTSELVNDSGFITIASVPTKTSELVNDNGFIDGKPNVIPVANNVPTIISGQNFNGGYYTMGNIVIIQISGTVTGTFLSSDYWTIAAGLPTSLIPIALNVVCADNVISDAEAVKYTNGQIVVKSGTVELSGKTITICGMYIKN